MEQKYQIVKTGLNEYDVRLNGLTYFTGSKVECKEYVNTHPVREA